MCSYLRLLFFTLEKYIYLWCKQDYVKRQLSMKYLALYQFYRKFEPKAKIRLGNLCFHYHFILKRPLQYEDWRTDNVNYPIPNFSL